MIPRSWGKIEIVDEKPIGSLKGFFRLEVMWQVIEQLVSVATGILISFLIGWRACLYQNFKEKSNENSLAECLQRQNRFEKQLSSLQLQIIDFERTYLFEQTKTITGCDSCNEATSSTQELKQPKTEVDETHNKETTFDENESLVRRVVEEIIKQNCDKPHFEGILDKLIRILDKLSKLSEENQLPSVKNETTFEIENAEVQSKFEECYEKKVFKEKSFIIESKEENIAEEVIDIEENQSKIHLEEAVNEIKEYSYSGENSPYELQACKSNEKLPDTVVSNTGAGECEETFRGKIVPVSQIPKYQELRKNQKLRALSQKEYDDEQLIPFVSCGTTPDQAINEISTPQSTPRKNNSSPLECSKSRGGRKKLRS